MRQLVRLGKSVFLALSIVLAVGVSTMWIRSELTVDVIRWRDRPTKSREIVFSHGFLIYNDRIGPFAYPQRDARFETPEKNWGMVGWMSAWTARWVMLEADLDAPSGEENASYQSYPTPYWLIAVFVALPALYWLWRRSRTRKNGPGFPMAGA